MAEELTKLPRIAAALANAELTLCGVRELTRVATPETEARWLEAAVGSTVQEIEKMVSGRVRGDGPEAPPRPEEVVQLRSFELRNETYALIRQAKLLLEQQLGRSVSDDELMADLARGKIAEVAEDKSRRPIDTKIVLQVCPECEAAKQLGGAKWVAVDPQQVFHGLDVVDVMRIPSTAHVGTLIDDIPEWVRREVYVRDGGACRVPGCSSKHYLHCHHILWRELGGPHEPWNLLALCGHHRSVHDGTLRIIGNQQDAIEFRHADGAPYGSLPGYRDDSSRP